MIVLVIQVVDFLPGAIDTKSYPSIAGDAEAPRSFAVAGKLMGVPTRNVAEFRHVIHILQEGDDISDLLDRRRRQGGAIVALDEAPQSPMVTFRIFIEVVYESV
jgi:hypothetical protein